MSFSVPQGGTLGIVGRNGSGKTTLLRLLSGVSGPSEGRLRVEGRIAPMIGIGVGFNRELTGRENVLVNGRLLGMSADHVADRFDDIVAFAQLADHIDVPVKFYSSGMFLRLAFSVAVHTDPDVLLVDEILAVGDVAFQNRSFERMQALQAAGTTVVVVTHNLQVLQQITPRTLVLEQGQLVHDGDTEEALEVYHRVLQEGGGPAARSSVGDTVFDQRAHVQVDIEDGEGRPTRQMAMRRPAQVRIRVDLHRHGRRPGGGARRRAAGTWLTSCSRPPTRPAAATTCTGPTIRWRPSSGSATCPCSPRPTPCGPRCAPSSRRWCTACRTRCCSTSATGPGRGVAAMDPSMEIDGEPVDVFRRTARPVTTQPSTPGGGSGAGRPRTTTAAWARARPHAPRSAMPRALTAA